MDTSSLPQELTRDIFTRVPVKSLIRFESLSKPCSNLFKSPDFIVDHLHHSTKKNPSILLERIHAFVRLSGSGNLHLFGNEMKNLKVHASYRDDFDFSLKVVGCCNGLLCVSHIDFSSGPMVIFSLWNPAMRQIRKVWETKLFSTQDVIYTGFGYGNDYKIVVMYSDDHFLPALVELHSLSNGSCNKIDISSLKFKFRLQTVMASGSLFWMGYEESDLREDEVVICLDLGHERFRKIPIPTPVSNTITYDTTLAVHEDSLAILFHKEDTDHFIDLWALQNVGDSETCWSKLYSVGPLSGSTIWSVSVWKNNVVYESIEKKVKNGELSAGNSGLFLCNCNGQNMKILPAAGYGGQFTYDVFNYAESLIPVCSNQNEVFEEAHFTEG